jgi:hypothetical protein
MNSAEGLLERVKQPGRRLRAGRRGLSERGCAGAPPRVELCLPSPCVLCFRRPATEWVRPFGENPKQPWPPRDPVPVACSSLVWRVGPDACEISIFPWVVAWFGSGHTSPLLQEPHCHPGRRDARSQCRTPGLRRTCRPLAFPRFDGSAARPGRRRHRHLPFPRQRCPMDPRGKKRGPSYDRARRASTPTHPFHPVLRLALCGAYSG